MLANHDKVLKESYTPTEALSLGDEDPLLKVLALGKASVSRNLSEISDLLEGALKFTHVEDPQVIYHSLLVANQIETQYEEKLPQKWVFSQLSLSNLLASVYTEIQREAIKLMSLMLCHDIYPEFIALFPEVLEFLSKTEEDEFMEYAIEMLKTLLDQLSEGAVLSVLDSFNHVLHKAMKTDNIQDVFNMLEIILKSNSPLCIEKVANSDLVHHIFFYISYNNIELRNTVLRILELVRQFPGFVDKFVAYGIQGLLHLIEDPRPEVQEQSALTVAEFSSHKSFLDSLSAYNYAPVLINLLANAQNLKENILTIVYNVFTIAEDYQVAEYVENNLIAVLCRITERDQENRLKSLNCMEALLGKDNELYRAIANECRFSRLLSRLTQDGSYDVKVACISILQNNYPHVKYTPIDQSVNPQTATANDPSLSTGIFGSSTKQNSASSIPANSSSTGLFGNKIPLGAGTTSRQTSRFGKPANFGNSGNQASLFGNTGNQASLFGNSGNQTSLFGNTGNQTSLFGNTGNQKSLFGNSGNQTSLFGNTGNQKSLFGNSGNQTSLFGNTGNQTSLFGNTGNQKSIVGNPNGKFKGANKRHTNSLGKGKGKRPRNRTVKRNKADGFFPISRISAKLKESMKYRVGQTAGVYLSAVLEFLTAEILDISGCQVIQDKRKIILPRHIKEAVKNDEEFNSLLKKAIFSDNS